MPRNKEYDYKILKDQREALDIDYGKAIQRLCKMFQFHMAKQLGLDKCFQCKQPIKTYLDMSLEHKEPWRKSRFQEYMPDKFWDMNNLALSHEWCNSGAATRGTSKFGYFGVDEYEDNRKGKIYKKIRGRHTLNKKTITLGYFDTALDAAIAADIGVMRIREGCGPLNFESLREKYKEYLEKKFNKDDNIFYKRGPIKDIVTYFKSMVNEDEVIGG